MSFVVIATFKSNKTGDEVAEWVETVASVAKKSSAEIAVAPSFPHLHLIGSKLGLAAQDVSPFPAGSYTGAVNATQLSDLKVKYCLVGHSERRRYFHETSAEIGNKVSELLAVGITPILCLAEADIFPQFAALRDSAKDKIIYCYEPPENIGGSTAAPQKEIARVTSLIRSSCVSKVKVMYGGSVNEDSIATLLTLDLDGLLISSASLDPSTFVSIINAHFS